MKWSNILAGLVVGAILGIFGTFYTINERLVRLDERIKHLENRVKLLGSKKIGNSYYIEDDFIFNETFDTNALKWLPYADKKTIEKYFAKGKLIIPVEDGARRGSVPVSLPDLPSSFYIELKCIFAEGDTDKKFGMLLKYDDDDYYSFNLMSSGYAGASLIKGEKVEKIIPRKSGFLRDSNRVITQRIEKVDDNFIYYLNGKMVGKSFAGDFDLKKVQLVVNGPQTIEFDNLRVAHLNKENNSDF